MTLFSLSMNNVFEHISAPVGLASPTDMVWICQSRPSRKAKYQTVFNFSDIEGTPAGFFTPSFMSSLNVPGLHLHFLSKDLQRGGHLLECLPRKVRAGVQLLHTPELALPISLDYLTWDFRRDIEQDLDKVEK